MAIDNERRSYGPYVLALVVAAALIVIVRSLAAVDAGAGHAGAETATRTGCTAITVVSSSEKAALLGTVAEAYARADHTVEGVCADVHVVAKSSGAATDALVRGWDEAADGPRPDVWTPVTSSWLEIATERLSDTDGPDLIPEQVGHVA